MKDDKPGRSQFWKKIKSDNPLFYFKKSPIDIMFKNPINPETFYPWPAGRYLGRSQHEVPFRLIDAISQGNELVIRIGLNNKRKALVREFSKILTLALREMEKHGRKREKVISDREYDMMLRAYQRRRQGWTYLKIAEEIFPGDFRETEEGGKVKSAELKARRFCLEAKRLIERKRDL